MPDLRVIRPRAGVTMYVYPGEIADMVTQDIVQAAFSEEELKKIIETCSAELNQRENQKEPHNGN